jgi:phospholipid/cholesterol/gamma-HCH transport system substrate-binding protein
MKNRSLEVFFGLAIILITLVFCGYTYFTSVTTGLKSYSINANFTNIGSLIVGSKVIINGYEVGNVKEIKLVYPDYKVKVVMNIQSDIKIPVDSTLSIQSAGFFDAPSIAISAGKTQEFLSNNMEVKKTKDWVSLEDKIGDVLFSVTNSN